MQSACEMQVASQAAEAVDGYLEAVIGKAYEHFKVCAV